jgi:hypothetical protein
MVQFSPAERYNPLSGLSIRLLYRALRAPDSDLSAEESASTLFRFFRSKHVRDLKLIVGLAVLSLFILFLLVVTMGTLDASVPLFPLRDEPCREKFVRFFEFATKYFGPAVAVGGLVIGWAYRSASARLGVIDLFACEISTLCRVGTVLDVGARYVQQAEHPRSDIQEEIEKRITNSEDFVSREDYFPILETNAKDLQLLEALVVRYITEFYTYMKATRDSLRLLATLRPPKEDRDGAISPSHPPTAWGAAFEDVIYMLFLGYESGRKAVEDLIEYQPSRAENRMVILLTELKCYCFLRKRFQGQEVHNARLQLREKAYMNEVPELVHSVFAFYGENDKAWEPARKTAQELANRYNDAFARFGEKLTVPPKDNGPSAGPLPETAPSPV